MRPKAMLLVVTVLVAVSLGRSQVQQGTGVSSVKSVQQKDTSSVNARMEELTKSIRNLETTTVGLQARITELEQRQSKTATLNSWRTEQLNQVTSELEKFGCELDQDRAVALAAANRLPGYAYEGAGAMNCTTRLKNIVERAVQILRQQ